MTTTVPAQARPVTGDWLSLLPDQAPAAVFDPAAVTTLPDPAQRWLRHTLPAGVPLWRSVELEMSGQIRLGSWRRFTARQVLTPGVGYLWAATATFYRLPVSGYDRFSGGTGEMRWRLLGVVPVVTAAGPDVTRSAAGRLAAEGMFVPTTFALAEWSDGPARDVARCVWRVGGYEDTVDLHIDGDGRLREVTMQRWGQAGKEPARRRPFGVTMHSERRQSGIAVPDRFTGWWDNPGDGEFFRAEITAATFH